MLIRLQATALRLDEVVAAVSDPSIGAIVTFSGVVRDHHDGKRVTGIGYEAHASMAEAKMRQIAADVQQRWPGAQLAMIHRTGPLEIGEASVVIAAAAVHRKQAFEACEYAIDTLKHVVPIWKKEAYEDGTAWLEDEYRLAQAQGGNRTPS